MGVRVISDIARFGFGAPAVASNRQPHMGQQAAGGRLTRRANITPTLEVFHDGNANKIGCPAILASTTAWIDPSTLIRSGTNLGITASYMGAGSCTLYGSPAPSEYAYKVFDTDLDDALVAAVDPTFKSLGTVSPAVPVLLEFAVYTLLKVVFTADAGSLILTSR